LRIAAGTVVAMDYTLTGDDGAVLDSSEGRGPLEYLHGHGNIVVGLERALDGLQAGDEITADVAPEHGYGVHDDDHVMRVAWAQLPPEMQPAVGMQVGVRDEQGNAVSMWIAEVDAAGIVLDGNHPLAGKTLHFAVTVRGVRQATAEELSHGHPHGPDGHGHDHGH
jgi:FKBP-type peptidyl-prolyl cis-trans isomerase SlyD